MGARVAQMKNIFYVSWLYELFGDSNTVTNDRRGEESISHLATAITFGGKGKFIGRR